MSKGTKKTLTDITAIISNKKKLPNTFEEIEHVWGNVGISLNKNF